MEIIYKVEREINKQLDIFLEQNGDYTKKLYSSPKMLELVQEMYSYPFFNVLFYNKKEELIGFIPFFSVKSSLFGNRLMSLPFSGHGGGLCLKKDLAKEEIKKIIKEMCNAIKEISNKERIDSVILRQINNFPEAYLNEGFVFGEKEHTFLIELTNEKEMWGNLDKKVRNGIRKAGKEGLKLIVEDSVYEWHKLHQKTMKRLGTPPVAKKHFKRIKEKFGGDFLIFFAEYNGKKIGDISFFVNNGCIFWSTNDCLEEYRHLNVSSFLLFECIKYGIEKKCKFLDMGVSRDNSNNFSFKIKWKPKLFDTSKMYYFFGKENFISPNEKKYALVSNVWKRFMPESVANLIGPRIRKGLGS
ncbi:peptidoglycan bridge formation glycyltransferase FemA/FemB family protein [Candidatus Pacearchaeota archaeon]|nr:peptidoglycan bridge formation glycyltransferase FemA/FemB family protein [Candidatus Pacearchaeota archaeon]